MVHNIKSIFERLLAFRAKLKMQFNYLGKAPEKDGNKDINKDITNVCQLLFSTGTHIVNSEAMGDVEQRILHSLNRVTKY